MAANGPLRATITVANPNGLHMRPATAFALRARAFRSNVVVKNGDKTADGKSMWSLVLLVAHQGAELTLEVDGEDSEAAIGPLSEILASCGDGF